MLERIPPFQMQCTMQHYLQGYMNAHENTSLSKCKVQILHYLLELFFVLENTHLSPFRNAKYKCDIICWDILCIREYSPFQIQSANKTLLTGII